MKANINIVVVRITVRAIVVTTALMNSALTNRAWAMPAGPHHSFLTGPWELVVKMGLDGPGLRFPLTVIDENKPQKLDAILPVMGTPIKIRLEEYVPDLKWETTAVKHTDGGIAAKLTIKGKNLEQNIWLCSGDPARQSISSSIGGIAIRKFHNPKTAEKLVRELIHPDGIGILSIWPEDSNLPFEYVAKVAETITIPNSKYKLAIAEYLPHYSIDTKTKKAFNQSEKPINPAVKVSVHDGENATEQWLWAKFPSSPHKETQLPLRMRFTDFDLSSVKGMYILIVASGTKPWLLLSNKGEKQVERIVFNRFYPFADKEYFFSIERIICGAIIKEEWRNNSDSLLHPAIIATIEQNGSGRQTVLELNKPFHYKTKYGTMVLFYRRKPHSSIGAD